jgi:serine/threonine protein phosphatase PrpC
MSDTQREGTQEKGATRNADSADASRPSNDSSRADARASTDSSRADARASTDSSRADPRATDSLRGPRASAAEPLGLEDVSFEQDEEGSPLHPEVGLESAAAAENGEVSLTPKPITAQVVGRSDVGLVREHNEDNYLLADLSTGSRDPATFQEVPMAGLLLGVCDGMGGAAAGEVASQMAVDTIFEMMRRSVPASDRDALARALVRAIEEAGGRIFEGARADRSRRGMGTTSTIAALMDKTLFVGQVGDSRAYVLRGTELKQITKDQSLVNQLIEAGQLTEDEAEAFEHSNIILQALGTTEQVSVDLTFLELRRGDRLLMCSDGLSGLVHGDVIREVMVEYRELDACCERLIELAKAGGGHDNVTVILAEFGGEGLANAQTGDLAGYQQYPLPLDGDPRATGPIHSDVPTLAPPGGRGGSEDPSYSGGHGGRTRAASGARYLGLLVLLAVLLGAAYYWSGAADGRARSSDNNQRLVEPSPPETHGPPRVEVVVRSDVEGGELFVDGETYGKAEGGRWVLDLVPGPHKLEAKSGGSTVTSSVVTVREGVPATAVLSMPEGAGAFGADAAAAGAPGIADPEKGLRPQHGESALDGDAGSSERELRRRKRRAAREAANAEKTPASTP